MALNTVENDVVVAGDEFSRCGDTSIPTNECYRVPNSPNPSGSYTYNQTGNNPPTVCTSEAEFRNDYAISRGYSAGEGIDTEKAREYHTDQIRCK
jgi:hypothetical protein